MRKSLLWISWSLVCLSGWGAWGSTYDMEGRVPVQWRPFSTRDVTVADPMLMQARAVNMQYLLSLETDRLLWAFRKNSGLPTPGTPLGGWEAPDCEVRGHFVGHFLSACALTYESTGDEGVKAKALVVVRGLAECQQKLGGQYLSAYPDSFITRWENRERVWAPFYTIHKIMAGLLDVHVLCGDAQSLEVLDGMVKYFLARFDKYSESEMDTRLDISEEGGICEVLWDMYGVTGKPEARALAEKMESRSFLRPMANGEDVLDKRHGNTHIPLAIGAARRYELTGDKGYQYAAQYFWDRVVTPRCFANGGTTDAEVWGPPFKLAKTLSRSNSETCKTHNLLKLTRHLLCWNGDMRYGDYYERAFLNGLRGTQEPESGMLSYYAPMKSGFQRVYGTPFDTFWCCYGTGVENWSKVGDSIYFHSDNAVLVNLFLASQLDWKDKGVRIEQKTDFPKEDIIRLTVHTPSPQAFTLSVRIPGWTQGRARIWLNDELQDTPVGAVFSLERSWQEGDNLRLEFPMALHTEPMPDDPNLVAFAYGPVLLAGVVSDAAPLKPIFSFDAQQAQAEAVRDRKTTFFLADSSSDVSWLQPVKDRPLTFRTSGQPFDLTFIPFGEVISERYGLYFPVVPENSPRHLQLMEADKIEAAAQALLEGVFKEAIPGEVDRVIPDGSALEVAHALRGEGMANGPHLGHYWRHAEQWWSWELRVSPEKKNTLHCIYWGSDVGRNFDVLVGDTVVAQPSLNNNAPDRFFKESYEIPVDVTKGKERVTVTFKKRDGYAGGVFFCATSAAE